MTDEEVIATLDAGQLEIWHGRRADLPQWKIDAYKARWRGEKPKPTIPLAVLPNCPHLGEATGEKVSCRSCSAAEPVAVFACALHGEATIAKASKPKPGSNESLKCCKWCDDNPANIEAKRIATEAKQRREADQLSVEAANARNLKYQAEADAFVARLVTHPPDGRYSGKGITIAAGGKYWASAYVTIRMLRHVGCTLPVWCGYLGASGERDERYERLLAPHGVTFVDIDTHPARAARRGVAGFQTKLFLAINSPFEEVLNLDPDAYPCEDPTPLFNVPGYRKLGGIYWPDGPQTDRWTNWAAAGVKPRGPCGLETGMYVIDKRIAWEPMMLAEWYDDHPEWTHGGPGGAGGLDYGDKGPHRIAWAKLERDYVVFNPKVQHIPGLGFVQLGPDGRTPVIVHCCHRKFSVDGPLSFPTTPQQEDPDKRYFLPGEEAAFEFLAELKARLKK